MNEVLPMLFQHGSHPVPTAISGPRPWPPHPWLFGRHGQVGCDAFKDCVSERDGALSAIEPPTSTSPVPLTWPPCLPGWSLVPRCYLVCNGSRVASLISSTAASVFSTRAATFDFNARAGFPGSTGAQYRTSQPALLRLPAHFRQIGQISRPAGMMHNAPHKLWLSAVLYHPIFFLTGLQWISHSPRRCIRLRCGGG